VQADGLADLAHGGRVAVLGAIAPDELEDLALPLGQIHRVSLSVAHRAGFRI
jgi:hypothetical protein